VNNAPELGRPDNRLLAALPRETLASFGQDLKQVSLSQGTVCYEAGDRIDRVYFPISGMISLFVAGRNGEIVETGIIGREGAAGLQSALGERRSYNRVTIQIPGHFAVISAGHFEQAVSNSAPLRDLVLRYVETRWGRGATNRRLQRNSLRLPTALPMAIASSRPYWQRSRSPHPRISS